MVSLVVASGCHLIRWNLRHPFGCDASVRPGVGRFGCRL